MAPERCLTFSWFSSPDLFGSSVGSHQKSHWPLQEKPWSHKLFLALQSELQKWKECLQISTLAFKKKFNLVKSITEFKACSHKHIESSNFILAQNISVKARELRLNFTHHLAWYKSLTGLQSVMLCNSCWSWGALSSRWPQRQGCRQQDPSNKQVWSELPAKKVATVKRWKICA